MLGVCASVVAAGCGGGQRQDADEPSGTWTVDVVKAQFPKRQRVAQPAVMRIEVRNRSGKAVPNVAVTVDGFNYRSQQPGLADPNRPLWILDDEPRGGVTAYTNTWALGRIPPGRSKTFEWHVTPVVAGQHRLTFRVSAGLDGKAKARLAGGGIPQGRFAVNVSDVPAQARVDPNTGRVIRTPPQ